MRKIILAIIALSAISAQATKNRVFVDDSFAKTDTSLSPYAFSCHVRYVNPNDDFETANKRILANSKESAIKIAMQGSGDEYDTHIVKCEPFALFVAVEKPEGDLSAIQVVEVPKTNVPDISILPIKPK